MEEVYMLSAEKLFKKYFAPLCHFAWQLTGDKMKAEDIVQDVFVAFLEHKHGVARADNAIKNYLYSSVRNACYNIGRDARIEGRYFSLNPWSPIEESTVVAQMIRSEVMNEVHHIVAAMPKACRKIFQLGYLEGWSNAKIAEKLQVSINTVKTQKKRGLKILKIRLNPEFFGVWIVLVTAV